MNKAFLLPVAALFVVACAEPMSPTNFEVAAARQVPTAPPTGSPETFENSAASLTEWSSSQFSVSPGTAKLASTRYLGRLLNGPVTLSVPEGASSVTISFDLYIIGTWDGAGIQGFGGDLWQLAVSRNGGALENVFHTSFSNQATKPQHYPRQIDGGTNPNGRGAYALNYLGYPKGSGKFDVGDAIYRLTFTVSNPGSGPMVFSFHTTTPLQDLNDESWGLDNVLVTRN